MEEANKKERSLETSETDVSFQEWGLGFIAPNPLGLTATARCSLCVNNLLQSVAVAVYTLPCYTEYILSSFIHSCYIWSLVIDAKTALTSIDYKLNAQATLEIDTLCGNAVIKPLFIYFINISLKNTSPISLLWTDFRLISIRLAKNEFCKKKGMSSD